MKWLILALAIAAISQTERMIKIFEASIVVSIFAARIQYPLWLLLALDLFADVSWLIGLYGMMLGLIGIKIASFLKLQAELLEDGLLLIAEIKESRRQFEEARAEIEYLQIHGCPAKFNCQQMGMDGKRCRNFQRCLSQEWDVRDTLPRIQEE